MKRFLLYILFLLQILTVRATNIRGEFNQILQMLADFTPYLYNQYQEINDTNHVGESLATFKGENTFGNNEQGVRHNADLSMICAFLCKHAKGKVILPNGISWEQLEKMGRNTLVYAYSTHKANRLFPCKGNTYWGSVSTQDHAWESSLWAFSVAFSAFFQWNQLTDFQHQQIYQLLKAECNYELERDIPTNYVGDTKAEENGWECNVLAATLGLFPDDPLAPKWFNRLREFAINCYSHPSDHNNETLIDDTLKVKELFRGANLYEDYTLQNHNYFHTSYQNVVMQELGESWLALQMFQNKGFQQQKPKWMTEALLHNFKPIAEKTFYPLALSDGELAMPNGNDWSLFLYDQITSYATLSCLMNDEKALYLELQALKQIQKRQQTTDDGSFLLHPDVGARRMGVEAHRLMMTWLLHEANPNSYTLQPIQWEDFVKEYGKFNYFPSQDIVTASSRERFTCFSWSKGLKSYTGYFAPTNALYNNVIVPYRAYNTGNFIGWYTIEGKKTDAIDVAHKAYPVADNSYILQGTLLTNEKSLLNNYLIYVTEDNLILYLDYIKALQDVHIQEEMGGILAVSNWEHFDDCVGVLTRKSQTVPNTHWGNVFNNNSVETKLFSASYSDQHRNKKVGEEVDTRLIAYYSNVNKTETERLNKEFTPLLSLAKGWFGYKLNDSKGTYLVLYNLSQTSIDEKKKEKMVAKMYKKYKAYRMLIVTEKDGEFHTELRHLAK